MRVRSFHLGPYTTEQEAKNAAQDRVGWPSDMWSIEYHGGWWALAVNERGYPWGGPPWTLSV